MKYLFSLLRQRCAPISLDRTDVFIWIWYDFFFNNCWSHLMWLQTKKWESYPWIYQTVLTGGQLRMPRDEGTARAERRGPGLWVGSLTFLSFSSFHISSSDYSVPSSGFGFITCTSKESLSSSPRTMWTCRSTSLISSLKWKKKNKPPISTEELAARRHKVSDISERLSSFLFQLVFEAQGKSFNLSPFK